MSTTPILVTGGSGMIGSRVIELLSNDYVWHNMDLHAETPVDITNETEVAKAVQNSSAQWIVHFAAFTDVTAAHQQNGDTNGIAYKVNVTGTQAIANACKTFGKKLLHISTAYIFDGTKQEPYVETDSACPIEWYGQTKAFAEDAVIASRAEYAILRIDNPFRQTPYGRLDVVRRIAERLKANTLPPQFSDSHFGPTVVEDTAQIINWIITNNALGIWHGTNNESWTPFAFASAIANKLGISEGVNEGSLRKVS